jgi:UDP-N-acetylmuramoyl-L-alanyl-D-glutamate--2,6-diaminopimelate ligase
MAEVAERNCQHIILTNEDPYDEDPQEIVKQMFDAITDKTKAEIVLDRREAIKKGLSLCHENDALLISGKGTDPYIMIENGHKIPWSDENVAREEIRKILGK